MTTAITNTATIIGIDAHVIEVEADVSIGLGHFSIVGLPDGAIKESRDRIVAALNNACNGFPIRKVVVNLAPADIKKTGTGFDLPIALSILEASQAIPCQALRSILIAGELSLEGRIRPIDGILALALAARKAGLMTMIVPAENGPAASLVKDLTILTATTIQEVIQHFNNTAQLPCFDNNQVGQPSEDHLEILDFSDVRGQETAKRALEIAASGSHNVLFTGPPGSGKSMLAKRMPSILPPLSFDEALEVTKIHSISGTLAKDHQIIRERPFRSPHHSISGAGLVGGGSYPKPGEISLAHHGVLFLDELPEFPRSIIDLLRQPIEEKRVIISRANSTLIFPSDHILLAAMNPCPCGYLGDSGRDCLCSASSIIKYRSKISGPMMDRIDLQVEMPPLSYDELNFSKKGESSKQIRSRVMIARTMQLERFSNKPVKYNSGMNHQAVEQYCGLKEEGHRLLSQVLEKYRLSSRAHDSVLKVARTIADLEQSDVIETWHLAEAVNYRCLDKELNY
jgi:magnesium chelatase family protein